MKRQHKINFGWERPSEPIGDRYQGEIEAALRKAEKAYRKAQQDAARAERLAAKRAVPETIAALDEARRLVPARLEELRRIERLMRAPSRLAPAAVHRTGREERLEVGVYKRGRKPRRRNSTVKTTRRTP